MRWFKYRLNADSYEYVLNDDTETGKAVPAHPLYDAVWAAAYVKWDDGVAGSVEYANGVVDELLDYMAQHPEDQP